MGKKPSLVWRYFERTNPNEIKCILCGKTIRSSGNTTNLMYHLKSKHEIFANKTLPTDIDNMSIDGDVMSSAGDSQAQIMLYDKTPINPNPNRNLIYGKNLFKQSTTSSINNKCNYISYTNTSCVTNSQLLMSVPESSKSHSLIRMDSDQASNTITHPPKMSAGNSVKKNENIRIGFIGAGNIAIAMATGLINSGYISANQIYATAPSNNNLSKFKEIGCNVSNDNSLIFHSQNDSHSSRHQVSVSVLFVCVKPNIPQKLSAFWSFLSNSNFVNSIGHSTLHIVSVLAGVQLISLKNSIENTLGTKKIPYQYHLSRIMPNTACAEGSGVVGVTLVDNSAPTTTDLLNLIGQLGLCQVVTEEQLDAVCGLAGSGIAFVYSMIQAMADGGVLTGLPRETALKLAVQTVAGAAEMVKKSGLGPVELRNKVCSPSGTTITGVHALERGSFNATVMNAVEAAAKKSNEFSRKFAT